MTKTLLTFVILLISTLTYSQSKVDTIKVIFLHGSIPAKGQRNEYKTVGGLRGGHIVTQIDNDVYGFNFKSKRIRVFPHPFNKKGIMEKENVTEFLKFKNGTKMTIVSIPLTSEEFNSIKDYYERNANKASFDYAFFGMRCASTCYKGLSIAKVYRRSTNMRAIRKSFHPRQLRKKLCKTAVEKGYKVTIIKGRTGRIWEGDN